MSIRQPYYLDNRTTPSFATALREHLLAHRGEGTLFFSVDVATGFFTLAGFDLLAEELPGVGQVRLLLGAEPPAEASLPPLPAGTTPEQANRERLTAALAQLEQGMTQARDLLPFDPATEASITRLLEFLASGRMEVRRLEDAFLSGRVALMRTATSGSAFAGSANFSAAGLQDEPTLVLGHHNDPAVPALGTWFDDLWDRAAPYDLAALFGQLRADYPPYWIFLRVLYQLYGQEVAEEDAASGGIPVTQFQQHGIWRALRILNTFGGVLIADGVGLGKTFTAGEIIRLYRERRQRVLIVCPAALRDGTWGPFLNRFQLFAECLSYEQLARDRQLGGQDGNLKSDLDEYALIVVDEAHNYRNPNTRARAAVLRHLLTGPRRDLVLLTATPVNNSLWDLYHLLRYFLRQDAALADRGVLSLHELFEEAMRQDPMNLNPDLLYPIIDATTVKRTRHFVRQHYPNDLIGLPDGRRVPLVFPRPVPSAITYNLEQILPGFLARLEAVLMPAQGEPLLSMARYQTESYRTGGEENAEAAAIVGLLRSGLLKRFESSIHAFGQTTAKMLREHNTFLEALDAGRVLSRELVRELSAVEDDDEVEEFLSENVGEAVQGFRQGDLRAAVEADRDLLEDLTHTACAIGRADDPKLAALADELASIATEADRDGIDEADRRRKRKVLVFSFYSDTIDWIEEYLTQRLESDPRLTVYRGRMASVAGSESRGGISRTAAVEGFAPESARSRPAAPGEEVDRFDLLLTTDVLAEGMNLQQCRNIINYDLPWNPMRLVQRHGRVDRIGSPHKEVYLRTFFPDRELDRLLELEGRVRRKLAQAAASIGQESAPLVHFEAIDRAFAETCEEIERLRAGDATLYEAGGTPGAAQTGEEYRQELRRALQRLGNEIRNLPWKAGSGLARGKRRGHFFCATVGERTYLRFVPFEAGEEIERELGYCLRLIECTEPTPRVVPEDLLAGSYPAWQRARQDIWDAWTRETDPANLQPRVSRFNRQVAEFLRRYPPEGVDQQALERCLEAIESPCTRREENHLREVFNRPYPGNRARSRAIVDEVARLGLQPFQPPAPLPPIREEEIHLICWMAVEKAV